MEKQARSQTINNQFYDDLGEDWFNRYDHPIALLRAENELRIPWIKEEVKRHFSSATLLDIGCGAGILTNALSIEGHKVVGIDRSAPSLQIAKNSDQTKRVSYLEADATSLPFAASTFDVVTALDVLEHVEDPSSLIREASRVLKPEGLFFFHTFNRNFLSYLVIIKGVEWFVKNTPASMHCFNLFITPEELASFCGREHLEIRTWRGMRPKISPPFFKMLATRKVPNNLAFCFTSSLRTGYCGMAIKKIS